MIPDILGFFVCAALITWSGSHLSKQGSLIAELTGLSKAWIGLALMATVTSLPELVTGISSVTVVGAPDLAVGNVIGSCAFNLLILVFVDVVGKPVSSLAKGSNVLAGTLGIVLLASAGVAVLISPNTGDIFWVSPFTPVLLVIYVLAMREIGWNERMSGSTDIQDSNVVVTIKTGLTKVLWKYAMHALIVTVAALVLPEFGERIAEQSGLSQSFVGTVFLAATTSLPELVVSVSALRMGAVDMAIGNLLGSNVFNIAILALLDLVYLNGSLYANISGIHSFSILGTIGMTAVVVTGLVTQRRQKIFLLSLHSWIVLIVYVLMLLKI